MEEIMVNQQNFHLGWGALLKWTIATALGLLIADGIGFVVGSLFPNQICAVLAIIAAGLFIGGLQWLFVLRTYVPNSIRWLGYTTLGWTIGWILGSFLSLTTVAALLLHGTILGFTQAWFFQRRSFSKSFLWILVNAIGMPLGFGLSWFVIFPILLGGYDGPFSGPADSLLRGILFGVITGATVLWFSRNSANEDLDSVFSNVQ
jgi:hypothetical protein